MKNFLEKHYDHYYIQTADGRSIETTRAECFAPSEAPTAENPYKQRWHYDIEAGYIVRLPRNEKGEKLYRANASAVKSEERHYARKYACVRKGTGDCGDNCANCQKTHIARTVDLDKPQYDDEGNEYARSEIEAPDAFADIEEKEDDAEKFARIHEVIGLLNEKQKLIVRLYFFEGRTAKEIGEMFEVSKEAIIQQLSTIKNKIKKLF